MRRIVLLSVVLVNADMGRDLLSICDASGDIRNGLVRLLNASAPALHELGTGRGTLAGTARVAFACLSREANVRSLRLRLVVGSIGAMEVLALQMLLEEVFTYKV